MQKLGVESPRVAVAGLNPHAGENGLFGTEDAEQIAPAVAAAVEEGIDATGPHPPDTVMMRARTGAFDIVVVQYHDQGHIPIKLMGFDTGVNVTVGLPFFRTSVDHGTAFDIAGTGEADPASLRAALDLARSLAEERGREELEVEFPKVVKVRQKFPRPRVESVEAALREQLGREEIASAIRPGMSVALTAGSRGIAEIDGILRSLVAILKEMGAEPFIVPSMGSHGGATAEGQVEILESLGVTEEFCGAPIRSSMEVVELGETERGVPVYMDRIASEADGVVLVNRIKAHTDFRSNIESGLMKMASIGLGKHEQALALHGYGVEGIRDFMVEVGDEVLESGHILFGVATVENAYDEPAIIEAIPAAEIHEREAELLAEYMRMMPGLPVSDIDVLYVDSLGKNYSGTGMDTNVIGRFRILGVEEPETPAVKYVIVGDISEESHGNALGVGLADLTTRRLADQIEHKAMNANVVTSTFIERAKVPMVLASDEEALQTAVRCNWGVPPEETRFVRIPNTLHLEYLYVSENLVDEVLGTPKPRWSATLKICASTPKDFEGFRQTRLT